ncbi:MAG TPA: glycosyltransferase [Cyclobacteriaceae bacterium]|jgi:cellulose synthase/poly-beta-1,6-N-acetylglucosamine synthase-like glycosyltransferase|nr:glycosyltransferase [Cyclobacteriaceae bacterium]
MLHLHNSSKEASVIISYYKNLQNLEIILLALNKQTAKGSFEVIVSEDDDAKETIDFINQQRSMLSYPLLHVSQADEGFRKCKALNASVVRATTDFIIFIDGDCVPHKKLVKEYIKAKRAGRILYGRRVMLNERISSQLLKNKKLSSLNFFNLLISGCKRVEEGLYLKIIPQYFKKKDSARLLGCNMGIFKSDLVAINGFDEDYVAPGGGEDTDIEWRLEALKSIEFYSMKYRAIVYHLYHIERFSTAMEIKTRAIVDRKIQLGFFICKNGIEKHY